MKAFEFILHTIFLSSYWLQPTISTYPPGKEVLYYGFFFDEIVASSIQNVSSTYFEACLQKIPEFKAFMESAALNTSSPDIYKYYTRPLDPNEQTYDPLFHVTAKYCGEDDCSGYRSRVGQHIDHLFEMHLVGYYFTNRTFGIRVDLTPAQEALFDNNGRDGSNIQSFAFEKAILPGIRFENITENFAPTHTRAHVTLGTAPNISAVVTGFDLVEIIVFEGPDSTIPRTNVSIELDTEEFGDLLGTGGTVIRYFGGEFGDAFVIYPNVKVLTSAKFQPYLKPVNSAGHKSSELLSIWFLVISCISVWTT